MLGKKQWPRELATVLASSSVIGFGCGKEDTAVSPETPPTLIPNTSRSIDLDGNGSIDFSLSYIGILTDDYPASAALWSLNFYVHDSSQVQYTFQSGPIPMQDTTLIDDTMGWTRYPVTLASLHWSRSAGWGESWSGVWVGVGARTLAVRLSHQETYQDGWLKL